MTDWLGVVSAAHVRRGVAEGFAQLNHGKRAPLARLSAGDTLIYYSPTEKLRDGIPLQQFTAIGTVPDDVIWQADDGDFRPYRRKVTFHPARAVPLAQVRDRLVLTQQPNWGYRLRLGLVELEASDAVVLRDAMLQ